MLYHPVNRFSKFHCDSPCLQRFRQQHWPCQSEYKESGGNVLCHCLASIHVVRLIANDNLEASKHHSLLRDTYMSM